MSNMTLSIHTSKPVRGRDWLSVLRHWLNRRRDRLALETMSESALRDIGIDRGEIEYRVRHGREDFDRARIILR